MATTKPFLSYQQQLDKLENEKHLIITDRSYAESVLKRIGYFALIGGYKEPFKNPTTQMYKDGTTFEEIVALYTFDESLRELYLRHLLRIERNIRSLLSYYFTRKFGEQQAAYLTAANYSNNPKYASSIAKLIKKLNELAASTDYAYIAHQRIQHGNVPLWVLVNVVTFGSLSKMYEYMPQAQQIEVSKNFALVSEKELQQYLSVLSQFRNVCAHNERLFSHRTKNSIPDTSLHIKMSLPKRGTQYAVGKNDLFSVMIAFRYLLPTTEFSAFKKDLTRIMDRLQKGAPSLLQTELLDYMGFPPNWKKITAYKI